MNDALSTSVAFAYPKDSEFKDMVNHYILDFHESGILSFLQKKWLPQDEDDTGSSLDASELGYLNLIFPNLLLIGGLTLSITILLFEILVNKCQ